MRQYIDLVTPLMENDYGQGQPLDQLPAYVAKHVLEADNFPVPTPISEMKSS